METRDRLWGMGLSLLVGIGCDGEQTPAGTLPKRVPILPPPPPTPAVLPHPLPCCLRPPRWERSLVPHLPKEGRKDGKLHITVSGKLPAHLCSILPCGPRAFSPASFSSLRCCCKDISGSKEVNCVWEEEEGESEAVPMNRVQGFYSLRSKAEHLAMGFICPRADGPVLHP